MFTGHDHFYERIKPQQGIVYFVVGSGGQLRRGNIDRHSGLTASRATTPTCVFLVAEIDGDEMFFNAISRTGAVIDSGIDHAAEVAVGLRRRAPTASPSRLSNTGLHLLRAIRVVFVISTPTSRRPSSSSLRRLWLPMNADVAVADHRAHVQPQVGRACRTSTAVDRLVELAEDADLDARPSPRSCRSFWISVVGHLGVVDQQLLLRAP